MTFKVVFFLMAAILVGLSLFSNLFRSREQKSMKLETNYFEALKGFKSGTASKATLDKEGNSYFKSLGLSLEESKKRIEKDLTLVNSSI